MAYSYPATLIHAKKSHGLCLEHFHPEQFYLDSDTGQMRTRMKSGVVLSVFPWNTKPSMDMNINQEMNTSVDSQSSIDLDYGNMTDSQMEVPSVFNSSLLKDVTCLGHHIFEADVYEEVIATDVVLGNTDESCSANAAGNNISDDKISKVNSDESSTANTAESRISKEKISVAYCKVPRESQESGGSHFKPRYDMEELKNNPA
ncbi:hypothetical protein QAD02_017315 [Eretmocerus hayati]|uniref:Uncharacterized protein n=1 Tax=Eretmocerus hayati TaxID=131215 RepID=A0ACC2PEM8_9HYME|nr:hypothetical protein QAD02_017315 [Eretmocerus hayati]